MIFVLTAYAQDEDLKKYPGYVNFEDIKIPDKAGEVTEILLGPALIKIAAMAEKEKDDDLSSALAGIHGIQVKSFDIEPSETAAIIPIMDKIEKELNRKGWERLVLVKEEDERVVVSLKTDDKQAIGLLVMALDEMGEVAFVNIVGSIDLNTLGNLDIDLDDSVMDSLKKHMEEDK
jgi:hypothetical protein